MPEPEVKPEEKIGAPGSPNFYPDDESGAGNNSSAASPASSMKEDVVREHLRSIVDPELGISIVELGLVYGIDISEDGKINVRMTLTSPACPLGAVIQAQVHTALTKLPWVKEPSVQLVWSPRWDPHQMASEDARMQLGIL